MTRIDALSKVLGRKIYTRDLRAHDIKNLPGSNGEDWGDITHHAMLLRATYLDRTFGGVNITALAAYNPQKCFLRQDDEFVNILDPAESYTLDFTYVLFGRGPEVGLFVNEGDRPAYTGQPLALLIFEDIRDALNAEREQLGLSELAVYGEDSDDLPSAYNVVDPISTALDKWLATGEVPPKDQLYGGQGVAVGKLDNRKFSTLDKSFENADSVVLRTTTPSVDPCFLEPDSSLGKVRLLDDGKVHLTLYAPTQSPASDEGSINTSLAKNITGSNIDLRTGQLGGGFGGRDFSTFPIYGAIAALVGQGTPVRLAQDRYAHFLSGIKRHASIFHTRIAYDTDGRLLAVDAKLILDGGSQKDLTTSIRGLALHSSTGAYRYDHWELRSLSMKNTGPLAGSMRGFGIPQVLFNTEQNIDQVAANLGEDAIRFRMGKVLDSGDQDVDEQILYHDIRNREVLEISRILPLWTERETVKQTYSDDLLYGVGFAMAMEAFGTTKDGVAVCVSLTDAGEMVLHTEVIELGQGATTGLADIFKGVFGSRPDHVDAGQVEQLVRPVKSKPKAEIYTKVGTTSASKSMFFHGHVMETMLAIWIERVWMPEAAAIWGVAPDSLDKEVLSFDADRTLSHPDHPDIAWADLSGRVLATGKSRIWAHGSFHGVWAWAKFKDSDGSDFSAWLDAIAILGNDKWPGSRDLLEAVERVQPNDARYGSDKAPRKTKRSVYASAGWLVSVEIEKATGHVSVKDAVCILDAGQRVNDSLVKGQVEGGFVQGLGFALLEDLPQGPLGGQRITNFNNYAIPRFRHMPPVETVFVDMPTDDNVLNPIGPDDPAPPPRNRKKGIAEISITPVAPAIANAVFHALSHLPGGGSVKTRPTRLPMTPEQIRDCIKEAAND